MGKIKGWKKVRWSENLIAWYHENPNGDIQIEIHPTYGKERMDKGLWRMDITKWIRGIPIESYYGNKNELIELAIKYMRSHSNG